MISRLNAIADRTQSTLSLAMSSWYGKVGLGLVFLATVSIIALLNPIQRTDSPKHLIMESKSIGYDQGISIPKVSGGATSRGPLVQDAGDLGGQLGVASRWTAINVNDPGQLLIDLTRIQLWRNIERNAWFQYIPKAHTTDDNRHLPILYELVNDSFECAEGMAEKISVVVYYEGGGEQTYYPWRYPGANEWVPVRPNTTLSHEMAFVCGVQLTADSPPSARIDQARLFSTWQVEKGAQGRIAAGPIDISETHVAWTTADGQPCVSGYQLTSINNGSTFPGGPSANDEVADAYTTFTLELQGPHREPCLQKMRSFTISLPSNQRDFAYFTAFYFAPQGFGTMRRVSTAH